MGFAESRAPRGYGAVQLAAAFRLNTECLLLGLSRRYWCLQMANSTAPWWLKGLRRKIPTHIHREVMFLIPALMRG